MGQDHLHHPLHAKSEVTEDGPLETCPELQMVFAEAQLHTDGNTIKEGTNGDFFREHKTTRCTGTSVGTND